MAALRRNRAASRVGGVARPEGKTGLRIAKDERVTIKSAAAARRRFYEKMANEAREQAKLENRLAAMEAKLRDAQSKNEEEEGALVANALVDLRSANADLRKENEKL